MRTILRKIGKLLAIVVTGDMQHQQGTCDKSHKANSYKYQDACSKRPYQIKILQASFLGARWAQAFQPNLLAPDDKALVWTLCHRKCHFRQAVRVTTIGTGKMRMTLDFATVLS